MILPLEVQAIFLLAAFAGGILTGLLFDTYRIIRGFNSPSKVLTGISDILFWILTGVLVFIFFLRTNYGDVRYYTILGIIFGLLFYLRFISKWFLAILRRILYYIIKLVRLIFIIITYPIKIILYSIGLISLRAQDDISGVSRSVKKLFKFKENKKEKTD